MAFVEFLQDYLKFKQGKQYDLRHSYIDSLVRRGLVKLVSDTANPEGGDGAAFTGTQGSVPFVGGDTELTEDNDTLFFDDTNERLGINAGTSPEAHLHVGGDVSNGDIALVRRTNAEATNFTLFVGPSGTDPDFAVWGDGRVSIGEEQATTNAMLRINHASDMSGTASALFIDQDHVGSITSLEIDHEGATGDAIQVSAACTTAQVIDVQADALTSGSIAFLSSNSSSTTSRSLLKVVNDHASANNVTCIEVRNDSSGSNTEFMQCKNLSSAVIHELSHDGSWKGTPVSSSDGTPNDDTSLKKFSIQKLSSPPTNAAYIAFSNNPGSDTFYLVMEEG